MTVRTETARPARFGARDIGGLIRIYEASYVRLTKLVPDLPACDRVMVSRVAGSPRSPPRTHRASAVYHVARADVPVPGSRRLRARAECPDQRLPRRAGGGSRLAQPPAREPVGPFVDSRTNAGDRPQVANEPLPPEVAEVLHVPGPHLPSRGDALRGPGPVRTIARFSSSPASPRRLTRVFPAQRSERAGTGGMRSLNRLGCRPRRCS